MVLHFHFGMSGAFKTVARGDTLPEPKETTRLVLIGDEIVGQLSAMIVQHGGLGERAEPTLHLHTAKRVQQFLTLALYMLTQQPVPFQKHSPRTLQAEQCCTPIATVLNCYNRYPVSGRHAHVTTDLPCNVIFYGLCASARKAA